MEYHETRMPIRNWAEDDRPREKFLLKGRHALSDTELLAILIGSGNRNDSAVDLAKKILESHKNNLQELSKAGISELIKIRGIGQARAIVILAALELGRRREASEVIVRQKITRSREAYEIFRSAMENRPYEEFWIILLNKANRLIRQSCISEGGVSGTVVDPKKIFKIALDHRASSIILGHNHPSGEVKPSEADDRITKKISEAGQLVDVTVLDHLIIGEDLYYSYTDDGKMQ
ncbi:MAG: DNA repair protein RadC [bacterium]